MESTINPKIRSIILEDLLCELYSTIPDTYIKKREYAKVDSYLTTGLNLCDIDNELLIIIPDYLISTIKRISFRSLKLPQEIPGRFIEFVKQNQTAIELIAFIHMQNLLTK